MTYTVRPVAGTPVSAQQWCATWNTFGGPGSAMDNSGVIWQADGSLDAEADSPVSMDTIIKPGTAMLAGRWFQSDADVTLTHDPANATYGRYDLIVARLTLATGVGTIAILKGTAGPSPTVPTVTQNMTTWEIPLWEVYIAAAATTIHKGRHNDVRRWWNGAANQIVQMCKASGTVRRGYWGVWAHPSYSSGDAYGTAANTVKELAASADRAKVAGVILENASDGDWVPVLVRGLYAFPAASLYFNPGTLVYAYYYTPTSVVASGDTSTSWPVGIALQWARSTDWRVWCYIDPAAYYALPFSGVMSGDETGDETTTSTSYVTCPSFATPSTFRVRSNAIEVRWRGQCSVNASNVLVSLGIYLTNPSATLANDIDVGQVLCVTSGVVTPFNLSWVIDLRPAYSNLGRNEEITFTPRWKTASGTATLKNSSGNAPTCIVREAWL